MPFSDHSGIYLTEEELARRLRVAKKTLSNWRVSGIGPPFLKMGGVRYRVVDVLKWELLHWRTSTSGVDQQQIKKYFIERLEEAEKKGFR